MGNNSTVNNGLAKLFDKVEHERGLDGPVDTKKSRKGLQPGIQHCSPDLGVKNAVAVVQQRIDGIRGAAMFTTEELDFLSNNRAHAVPIESPSRALKPHQRVADFVNPTALHGGGVAAMDLK